MLCQSTFPMLCFITFLLTSAQAAFGQQPSPMSRAQRVVIHSPHFDEPDPERGNLNCAAKPTRMFGFESVDPGRDTIATLRVRVFSSLTPEPGVVRHVRLAGAVVQLTHRISDGVEHQLPPTLRFGGTAGADGGLDLSVLPGVYRLKVMQIGYRGGEGVIQFRQVARDSLHIFLDATAICPP